MYRLDSRYVWTVRDCTWKHLLLFYSFCLQLFNWLFYVMIIVQFTLSVIYWPPVTDDGFKMRKHYLNHNKIKATTCWMKEGKHNAEKLNFFFYHVQCCAVRVCVSVWYVWTTYGLPLFPFTIIIIILSPFERYCIVYHLNISSFTSSKQKCNAFILHICIIGECWSSCIVHRTSCMHIGANLLPYFVP